MSNEPVVSVITPTWQRHELLLTRAVPSVQAQDYPAVEHLVISDGPDPELHKMLLDRLCEEAREGVPAHETWLYELPGHDDEAHYGHYCRAYGLELAKGEYITYCDDDDALRPEHCRVLAKALEENPLAGFAVSRMISHGPHGESVIGHGPVACGNVGTPMIMHRRSVLEHGTWDHSGQFEDWDLVLSWINAGIEYVRVDAETSDVWPSLYR